MMNATYGFDPNPRNAHVQLLRHVPAGARVLDIGCAGGYIGRALKEKGCRVWGIDMALLDARARRSYEKVWVGDVERMALKGSYDVVLLADVLEHLRAPERLLERLRPRLAKKGFLLVSIPNVANWKVRWQLLRGRWEYKETGILDRTHVRFYTHRAARRLLEDAGYKVVWEGHTGFRGKARHRPGLLAFQFLFKAVRA